ncbi:sel1 repeat family protein [Vulcaniibacterium tengchongense]|uniref:Sel1 repeat-containing protein n=1 Tax=Vulcaniibacterium tengchongense TaxID=1273429 RepID=A0A3N4W480_9GAMM|nr:sel1 repeat family protein [Vulcaniibacterium tengchongense]RPE80024.1 hypothetical protein EDC50_1855 [Vulcaniibacterium tengchongense]
MRIFAIVWGCALAVAARAAEPPVAAQAVVADTDRMHARDYDRRTRLARTHPNELWRLYGGDAAAKGQWRDALRHFRRAARHADKYSQHRISLMYWHGVGVGRDRALAYAWADLAAERLYPGFVVLREKMWLELGRDERERALREGGALYAEFGDAAAKPRLQRAILKARSRTTGSRTGYTDGRLQVSGPTGAAPGGPGDFDLSAIYADWRLDARAYWAVEDAIWKHGNVEVGPATAVDDPAD